MYTEIQQCRQQGLRKSQVAQALGLDVKTVTKYWLMPPDEFAFAISRGKFRAKRLDAYEAIILHWLQQFPQLSAAQIEDRLKERAPKVSFRERTIRRYVARLREKHHLPRPVEEPRQYVAVEELPPGLQLQLDFGETWVRPAHSPQQIKLYCFAAVLSHSRHKYATWLDRPFTSEDLVRCLEDCFVFYGGTPCELVLDQDKLAIVSENHGDVIHTRAFEAFRQDRQLLVRLCRKQDPESKGKIESVVKYLKRHFAASRLYMNLRSWNQDTMDWLARTGNAKVHGTTRRVPAELFAAEQLHLRPLPPQLPRLDPVHTLAVRKDNTVVYRGNRYSVPIGTYRAGRNLVVTFFEGDLCLTDETRQVVASHPLCAGKGQLIQNSNHRRDHRCRIVELYELTLASWGDTAPVRQLLDGIQQQKPRYVRDQFQLLRTLAAQHDPGTLAQAVRYCLDRNLYSAVDIKDAAEWLGEKTPAVTFAPAAPLPPHLRQTTAKRDPKVYAALATKVLQ